MRRFVWMSWLLGGLLAPLGAHAGPVAGPAEVATRIAALEREITAAEEGLARLGATIVPAQFGWGQPQGEDPTVRLNAMEGRMRQLNGQIEQLQIQLRRMEDQVRRFQEDSEFRFQQLEGGGQARRPQQQQRPAPAQGQPPQQRGDVAPEAVPGAAPRPVAEAPAAPERVATRAAPDLPPPVTAAVPPAGPAPAAARVGPGEPPRILGQVAADPRTGQPLDLVAVTRPGAAAQGPQTQTAQVMSPGVGAGVAPPARQDGAPRPGNAREGYDLAYGHFLRGDYDLAITAFDVFLASFPTDRQVGDALYWLGESHYQRAQWRPAAEAFLKSYTDFPNGPKAPESLLRLGMSLRQLGQRDAACASFAEVPRRYPRASAAVRQRVTIEQRNAGCV
jgi:tol-pal system protein YbgF